MILAHMIATDEEALICDYAETYHIYDYQSLPVHLAAIFACGLRKDSRIRQKMENVRTDTDELFLAAILDKVNWLCWSKTKDGRDGVNQPKSVFDTLINTDSEKTDAFDTPAEYEKRRKEILKGGHHGK